MRRRRYKFQFPQYCYLFFTFEYTFSGMEIKKNVWCGYLGCIVYPSDGSLMSAVTAGKTSVVDLLIELGADVNNQRLLQNWYCTQNIARSLLRAGAPGIGILHDFSIMDKVCKLWDNDLITSVFDSVPKDTQIPDLDHLLGIASCSNRILVVTMLLSRGAKITDYAIHNAGINGHLELANFLERIKE